ncbi:MAG: riboflavin synthase [Sedimentisphaerales bacterium]|nr:riboflavin synthase [Sedimentisphaerales bacterium]
MFTGLIEQVCKVTSVLRQKDSVILTLELGRLADECKIGESISVNGVCLTITKLHGKSASFDISAETLDKSSLGKLKPSSSVNIERAIKAEGRFGGHFVSGHIDGTATIKAINKHGDFTDITFSADTELLESMVVKGSVAADGVSLTISNLDKNGFSVALIPQTLRETTLGGAKIGDCINIENDIIIKAVNKRLDEILSKAQPLTVDRLRQLGF